ncbi:MAG TPA: family 16 glycoside hydrolase [Lacunisphaera sp.]|nr:family 16 glycoside hydrolase [Lacunisphaera sp.]
MKRFLSLLCLPLVAFGAIDNPASPDKAAAEAAAHEIASAMNLAQAQAAADFSANARPLSAVATIAATEARVPLAASVNAGHEPYNVRDYGAQGNGLNKDTIAIQRAIDACAGAGGGEVFFPAGDYLSGSLDLKSYVTLRLDREATLRGSPDLEDYPLIQARWEGRMVPAHRALVSATNATNIAILGLGRIAGEPSLGGRQRPRRPCVIETIECTGVHLEDITVTQARMWTIHPTFSDEILVRNITIRSTGANSDGIDVDSCRHVRIEGCDIESGDDCIALKSGRGLEGQRLARPSEDVLIRDCGFADDNFACIGIGSETSGGIRGVHIENCRFRYARTHAIYIKSRPGRGAFIEDIAADGLDVHTAPGGFLRINLLNSGLQDDEPVPGAAGIPAARNFHFTNVKVDCGTLVDAASIPGDKPLDGLELAHIAGTATRGIGLANMINVSLADIHVTGLEGPLVATRNVTGTGLEQATAYKERVVLWNGRTLDGWHLYLDNPVVLPSSTWSAQDGVLRLDSTEKGYLRTEREFSNYHLHVEWRWPVPSPVAGPAPRNAEGTNPAFPANSNSGVLVHVHGPDTIWPLCFECQLKNGNAGQIVGLGLDIPDAPLEANRKRAPRLADPSEKPPGEWNTYEILCRGDSIECFVNGVRQNRVDHLPASAGAVALQLEGFPIEFRNVWLEEL